MKRKTRDRALAEEALDRIERRVGYPKPTDWAIGFERGFVLGLRAGRRDAKKRGANKRKGDK